MVRVRDLMGAFSSGRARSPARIRYPTPGNRIPGACPEKTRTRGTQVITPGVLIIPEQQESIQPASVTGICPGSLPCRSGVRVFRWPGSVLGVIRYLETCTQSRTGRSSAPPSSTPPIGTSPSGWSRPHSDTFSPLSVHFQSTWGSTYMSTYVDPRGPRGVQRRRG
jgi:hypothetical protein